MEFHKPKAAHTWREFASEIAIVVVGVLIALSAEQVVSRLHEAQMAQEARGSIRRELQFNMARLALRQQQAACVGRRLDELQALLDRAPGPLTTPKWIGRPQFWSLPASRWQSAAQAGRAVLLPTRELGAYGLMHTQMASVTSDMEDEQTQWAKLRALEHLHALTPEATITFDETLQVARFRNWRIGVQTTQIQHLAGTLGLQKVTVADAASQSICVPTTTPRDEAQRLSRYPLGEP